MKVALDRSCYSFALSEPAIRRYGKLQGKDLVGGLGMVNKISSRILNNILSNYAELEREEEVDTIMDDVMLDDDFRPQASEDIDPCRQSA